MVTTFYPPYNFGGDGIFVYRLSNELARRGHSVDVMHCIDAYQTLSRSAGLGDYPNHPNVRVHGLKSKLGFLSPLLTHQTGYPLLKARKIKRLIGGFDVIHFHNISLVGGPGVLKYGKAIKLYTTHEHWLLCPLSVLWKFDSEACVKKSCLACTVRAGRPPQLWRYTGFLKKKLKYIDSFISPSRFTIDKHLEAGLDLPFVHIPHFLHFSGNEEGGKCADGPGSAAKPYFLYVGRLEKSKGLQDVIKVFGSYSGSELLIAGDGQYEAELQSLANGAGHIRFLGRKSHQELKGLYQNATAVIVPTLCYEVFGMIIMEAFSTRTPVIVKNRGALPELVRQSRGGLIYDSGPELLNAVNALAADPALGTDLGELGYRAYRENWTDESHFERYFDLIYEIAGKKGQLRARPEAASSKRVAGQ